VDRNDDDAVLDRFLSGRQTAEGFHHRDHLRVAYGILGHYSFSEAAYLYASRLRDIAARAGQPGRFHETVTLAFLSLVAEHRSAGDFASFDDFVGANPELLDKSVLLRWYRRERLNSGAARRTFLLPEPQYGDC
jgi:hypothetical protein